MEHISKKDKKEIREIINTWPNGVKFTWTLVIKTIEEQIGKTYSRQALSRHDVILLAFQTKKKNHKNINDSLSQKSLSRTDALVTIEKLKMKMAELEKINEELFAQFARWARNAESRGLLYKDLNRPLPSLDIENQ